MGGLPLGTPEPPPPYIPYVPPKEDAELVARCGTVLKKNPKQINALSDQEAVFFSREIMEALLPILKEHGKSLVKYRRMSKDYEYSTKTSETMIFLCMARTMISRYESTC